MIKFLFDRFDKINSNLSNKISEISVKQSRITFDFEDQNILSISDLKKLENLSPFFDVTEITTFQDMLFVVFDGLDEKEYDESIEENPLGLIYSFIKVLAENLCTCPMLEYQIAENYIKIYIDVPNVFIKDLANIEEIMQSNGTIESSGQRTYLLYVKDW